METVRSMIADRVLFLGGNPKRTSVRIRCVQIAEYLGYDYRLNVQNLSVIPEGKDIFFCVKPNLLLEDLEKLAERGVVIWDIQDFRPPEEGVDWYVASSQSALQFVPTGKLARIIAQHHCNSTSVPNPAGLPRKPTWIGRPFWCPEFAPLDVAVIDSNQMHIEEVIAAYRTMGLGLNLRRRCEEAFEHIILNDGGKLLNCLAFGIPSISDREPAYLEYGDGCTLFCNTDLAECIERLQQDDQLYNELRERGLEQARRFHIQRIAEDFVNFLTEVTDCMI